MATLFEECMEQLGEQARVMSEKETIRLFDELQDSITFTTYGRIDWEAIELKERFSEEIEILPLETRVFIMWDNALFPAIESSLSCIMNCLESVKKVSFDTWIFSPNKFVIEFYHEGESNIGYLK